MVRPPPRRSVPPLKRRPRRSNDPPLPNVPTAAPAQIKKLKRVKTNRGYCRAWIRLALNEASLESYLNMFVVDTEIKPKFYMPCVATALTWL